MTATTLQEVPFFAGDETFDGQAAEVIARHYPEYGTVEKFTGNFMRYLRICGKVIGEYNPSGARYLFQDGSSVDACYETMTVATTPAGTHNDLLREYEADE